MKNVLWWCVKNMPKGQYYRWVGVVVVSPNDHVLPRAFSLTKSCSNNMVEYNALLIGLQLAWQMGVTYLEAYSDSKLIINQSKESMRFSMKTWYLITIQPSNWLTHLMASTSVMCLAFKAQRQTLYCTCGYIGFISRYQLPSHDSYSSSLLFKV